MKRQIGIVIVIGVIMFAAGFLAGTASGMLRTPEPVEVTVNQEMAQGAMQSAAAQGNFSSEMIQIRVNDGDVECFDGVRWNRIDSLEELAKQDKFYLALEGYEAFEELMMQKMEEEYQSKESTVGTEDNIPLVGQTETPKPTQRPRPAATPAPSEDPEPTPAPETSASAGSSNGNQSAGNTGSAATPAPENPPQPEPTAPPADDSSSGDGENMEWSDDYL